MVPRRLTLALCAVAVGVAPAWADPAQIQPGADGRRVPERPPRPANQLFLEHSLLLGVRLGEDGEYPPVFAFLEAGVDFGEHQCNGVGVAVSLGLQGDDGDIFRWVRLRPRHRTWLSPRIRLETSLSVGLGDSLSEESRPSRLGLASGVRLVAGPIGVNAELLATREFRWTADHDAPASHEITWTALFGTSLMLSERQSAWFLLAAEAFIGVILVEELLNGLRP